MSKKRRNNVLFDKILFSLVFVFFIVFCFCFGSFKAKASYMENMEYFEGWQILSTNDGYGLAMYDIPVGGSGYDKYRYFPEVCTTIKYYATISGTAESMYLSLSLGIQLIAYDENDVPRAFNLTTRGLYNDASLFTIQIPLQSNYTGVTDLGFSFSYLNRSNTDSISCEFVVWGPDLNVLNRYNFAFRASGRLLNFITLPYMVDYFDSRVNIPYYFDFMCVGTGSGSSSADYDLGYTTGYNVGYPLGYNKGTSDGYSNGFNAGASSGLATNGISTIIKTIVLAPINFISQAFNITVFGFNIAGIMYGIITVIICWGAIKLMKKLFS